MTGDGRYPANHATFSSPDSYRQGPTVVWWWRSNHAPFPCRSARPTHLQNLRRGEGWHRSLTTGDGDAREASEGGQPPPLAFVALLGAIHCPCLFCFPFCIPSFLGHHQPFFHQGLAIEAEGISHSAFPSHLVADDRATASAAGGSAEHWNHSSQSGRGNRGATQPRNTSARQSDTATRRPSVSPPTTSENPLETLARHRPPAKPTPQNRARKDRTLLPRPAIPLVSPRLVDTAIEHR